MENTRAYQYFVVLLTILITVHSGKEIGECTFAHQINESLTSTVQANNRRTQTVSLLNINNIETRQSQTDKSQNVRAQSCYQFDNSCSQCVAALVPGGCSFCASDGQCVPTQNATTYCGVGAVYFSNSTECNGKNSRSIFKNLLYMF